MVDILGISHQPYNQIDQKREKDAIELLDELLHGLEQILETLRESAKLLGRQPTVRKER